MALSEDRAWLFSHGTWSEIDEGVYSTARKEENPDLTSAFRLAGYAEKPIIQLGSIEKGFSVEVHEAASGKDAPASRTPYFINVMVGSKIECIYVADFPSFVMVMDQLSVIARSTVAVDQDE